MDGLNVKKLNAAALSVYFKRGIAAGFAYQNYENLGSISATVAHYIEPDSMINPPKAAVGLSYTNIDEKVQLLSINTGLTQNFFLKTNFPFLINASVSYYILAYVENEFSVFDEDPFVFGIGYLQAFFTNKDIFPYIGISFSKVPDSDNHIFSIIAGINLKLYSKSGN